MDVYNKIDTGTRFYDVNGDFISEHTAVLYKVGDKIADVGSVAVVVPITPSGGGGGGGKDPGGSGVDVPPVVSLNP
jgi:hypothetical protein